MRLAIFRSRKRRGVNLFAITTLALIALPIPALASLSPSGTKRRLLERPVNEGQLGDAIKVRLDSTTVHRLDRVVAFAQGKGRREVNRSYLIRDALDAYLGEVERQIPEIKDVVTSA